MLLSILLWIVAAYLAWAVLLLIAAIGQPRKPVTPGTAVAGVVIFGAAIAVIVSAGFALL